MGLWQRFKRSFNQGKHTVAFWLQGNFRGWNKTYTYQTLLDRYQGWVYTLANKNATTVASTELRVFAGPGNEELRPSHPLVRMMDIPNPEMTWYDVIEALQLWLELSGNAYLLIERNKIGVPYRVWPLMSQWMRIQFSKERGVTGYMYGRMEADRVVFSPDDIVHVKFPSVVDPWYGVGPLEAAVLPVDRLISMAEYSASFYRNQARPDLIIQAPFGPDAPEYDRVLDQWKTDFRQTGGKPIMLPPGSDVTPIGYPPKDLAEIKIAEFTRDEIAAIFQVPISMFVVTKSRAELQAALQQYAMQAIVPRCKRMENALTVKLARQYDDRIRFKFDNPVPEDRELRLKEIESHLGSSYSTINEEREIDGLDPIDGGDELAKVAAEKTAEKTAGLMEKDTNGSKVPVGQ